ncbi:hypothetical protein NHX12_023480 [Muraenolepis orangiensis]|uniref:KIND domain-containing protein n=1 Tax=Muraenolepis orangiensis TaxID=630683 RepID=A0A9Q0IQ17_9TELE|nr:hypothetical protein NHX12_023480 [Muraenolepis orangiensis]
MGCGGSRADAIIEPRYNESWTRETESTWLTNTDVETPVPAIQHSKVLEGSSLREKRMVNTGTQCGKQALASSGSGFQRRSRRSITEALGPPRESRQVGFDNRDCCVDPLLLTDGNQYMDNSWRLCSTTSEATFIHVFGVRFPPPLFDLTCFGGDDEYVRMAKRPGTDDGGGMLISPIIHRDVTVAVSALDVNMDRRDGANELSLEEILVLYSQPINEEQAWAVCYQCCKTLAFQTRRRKNAKSAADASSAGDGGERRVAGPGDVWIQRDGTVRLQHRDRGDTTGWASPALNLESPQAWRCRDHVDYPTVPTESQVIESLGIMIYKALDYGLKESEERELSPPLERLIVLMTKDIITLCSSHLPSPSDALDHYQAVCRALYTETRELGSFLEKIKSAKENLRMMGSERSEQPDKELDDLQNADWVRNASSSYTRRHILVHACFWVQVMRDLRHGVKLKKVQERQYNQLPIEFQLTPYEMLMDDIRSKRYKLRKVMANGDIPPRLEKSAHEVILDFIRSRPPLNPAAARKLKPHPPQPSSLHERLLADIKAERTLRPVSPNMIRRSRLGAGKSISTPQDLFRSSETPDAPRKLVGSTHSLANGLTGQGVGGSGALGQRKRLLRAPTLAELDSSESDEDATRSTSPEPVSGRKKVPPNFLPLSPITKPGKPGKPHSPSRRHSIEKESPTNTRPFLPLCRQSSKSLHKADPSSKEEFCYPVECLALTVEEVMHIRQVLVKAELEKFQQYKDIYTALKKGKMRLPSRPYSTLPIYSLGPSAMSKEDVEGNVASTSSSRSEKNPFGSEHNRHSLRRTVSKLSKHSSGGGSKEGASQNELELPKELTEDWATMEVCVDCKKFITEIIARSRTVATKRSRLYRKTQSFYLTSATSADFRPTERTINEV